VPPPPPPEYVPPQPRGRIAARGGRGAAAPIEPPADTWHWQERFFPPAPARPELLAPGDHRFAAYRSELFAEARDLVALAVDRIALHLPELDMPSGLSGPPRPTLWEVKAEENLIYLRAQDEAARQQREAEEALLANKGRKKRR